MRAAVQTLAVGQTSVYSARLEATRQRGDEAARRRGICVKANEYLKHTH